MGVRKYNVVCKSCGENFDISYSGRDIPNYGTFIIAESMLRQHSCRNCASSYIEPSKAHDLAGNAFIAAQQGDHEKAVRLMNVALKQSPLSAYIQNQACNVFTICEDYERAINCGLEAATLAPDWFDPLTNVADASVCLGHYSDAIELYLKAIRIDPEEVMTYGSLANAYSQNGDRSRAVMCYQEYIDRGGNMPEWVYNAADEYELIGQFGKARDVFNVALSLTDEGTYLQHVIKSRIAQLEDK